MLFSLITWGLLAAFGGVATALTPAETAVITQALKIYPACSIACLTTSVRASGCSLADTSCVCNNPALTAATETCILKNSTCTIIEGLQVQNASMTTCGAPIRDKSTTPLVIAITGGTLATLSFAMRMGTLLTRSNGRSIGLDDYFAGAALLLAGPPTLTALEFRDNGLGKDMWTLKLQQIKNVLMFYYLGSVFYIASITMVKMSLVCFILRVFPDQKFRRLCYCVMGLVAAYGTAFVAATALQCWPVDYAWQQVDSNYKGRCNDIHLQAWLAAGCNILLDLLLLVLPLHNLWNLNMGMKKKIMIMFMFSLGIFVTVISIIRLHSLVKFANSKNITWDYVEAGYWSLVEMHTSIICACLPYCRHLLIALGARFLQSTQSRSNYAAAGYANSRSRSRKNSEAGILASNKAAGGTGTESSSQNQGAKPPKHGDEGDFVPLVDYPAQHGRANWDKQTSVSTTNVSATASRASE